MSSESKNKKRLILAPVLSLSMLGAILLLLLIHGKVWTHWDFKALDFFYRNAISAGRGPALSSQIIYLLITDSSYKHFKTNVLGRKEFSEVNEILSELAPEAVAYDIIFARPSLPSADRMFTESLGRLDVVYLPFGLALNETKIPFQWKAGMAYERLRREYTKTPIEKGDGKPIYASRALMHLDRLSESLPNSGHISAAPDPDGVFRHMVMVVRIDKGYVPTLALSMLLHYSDVDFEDVVIDWGREIKIPAASKGNLDTDIHIPIDQQGRTFIPFAKQWRFGFPKMEAHSLIESYADENLRGNLIDLFEGKFVFIGDVSTGASDIGHTPLEGNTPLIVLHSAMLNGMLTNTFYGKWTSAQVTLIICLVAFLLAAAGIPKSSWLLYLSGGLILVAVFILTWLQLLRFQLIPPVTLAASALLIFGGEVIGIGIAVHKERAFIRNAFSKYVPEKVVHELLENPQLLALGGEERNITVLFSDLKNFTSFSEKISPSKLAIILNAYLTEMTDIVLAHGGIIDKYQGDAIMAEFGVPLAVPDHADRAVLTGLSMHRRLDELSSEWHKEGYPSLECRIGINTGSMIVGNMGSQQVFDYTVIGDAVNLASRLEGANKRYNTHLMISEFTFNALTPGRFRTRLLDMIRVKGKSKAVNVFEVYGEMSEAMDPKREEYYQVYQKGFESYLSRNFSSARKSFQHAGALFPNDPACSKMITRIDAVHPDAIPEDWDGSITLKTK